MPQRRNYLIHAALLIVAIILTIYFINKSNHRELYLWDESTYANNSLDMERNNNYWVYTVNNKIDHHNSKPPVVLWLQAVGYKLFGYDEFAVRFPSYLGLVGTLLLFVFYSRRITGAITTGLIAAVFLLTTYGAIRPHVTLTGDLDGFLMFVTTFIFLHHLYLLNAPAVKARDIWIYAFLFILGYLVKSTAILLLVPSIGISLLFDAKLRKAFFSRTTIYAILVFTGVIFLYYFLREMYDPGYWQIVWMSEFTRLTTDIQPWLPTPYNLYFDNLWNRYFRFSLIILAITTPAYLLLPKARFKKVFLHSLLMALIFLGFITIPPVKLDWYDAPVYPLLSFATAISIAVILDRAFSGLRQSWLQQSLPLLILLPLFWFRFQETDAAVSKHLNYYHSSESSSAALGNLSKKYPAVQSFKVLEPIPSIKFINLYDGIYFYAKALNANDNKQVTIINDVVSAKAGDTILTCSPEKIDSLKQLYLVNTLDTCYSCYWMVLSSK